MTKNASPPNLLLGEGLPNLDEAALEVAGHAGTKLDAVGKQLVLARGGYHITMVGQAPDDNHLKLVVT